MIQYLIRRIIWALALMLVVTMIGFVLFYLVPADPAKQACGRACPPDQIAKVAHYLGTDRPWYIQYLRFLGRLIPVSFHGGVHLKTPSLGKSFVSNQTVNRIVANAAPQTASLVLGGVVIWMLIALPVGILSALRPRSLLDRTSMTAVLIGVSMHPVWLGLILLYFFTNKLRWFPVGGYSNFFHPAYGQPSGPWQWAYHLFLPWITFAVLFAAIYVRMIRANVMDTMNEDFVRTARAKGAPESRVMRSHILRNALLPVVTMLGMDISLALGGAVFTESIYGLHGLGWWTIFGLNNFDSPTVLGILVFATTMIIVFNLFIDLVYAWIDPRIRIT